jgi:hypothetical protein
LTEAEDLKKVYAVDAPYELLVLLALQRMHPILVKMVKFHSTTKSMSLESLIESKLHSGDFSEFSRLTKSQLLDLATMELEGRGREHIATNDLALALTSGRVRGIRELMSKAGINPDEFRTWVLRISPTSKDEMIE